MKNGKNICLAMTACLLLASAQPVWADLYDDTNEGYSTEGTTDGAYTSSDGNADGSYLVTGSGDDSAYSGAEEGYDGSGGGAAEGGGTDSGYVYGVEGVPGTDYVGAYFGISRLDLVNFLVENKDLYVGTPYHEDPREIPTPGKDGHMQCEGFVWSVLSQVAKEKIEEVPCGDANTEPLANGGGWVNWVWNHNIYYEKYSSKEELLASGHLEKGDIIWSFDEKGPLGISAYHHVGFFWGDSPQDDKFWHSSEREMTQTFEGAKGTNRISQIEGMSDTISQWWLIKLTDTTLAEEQAEVDRQEAERQKAEEEARKAEEESVKNTSLIADSEEELSVMSTSAPDTKVIHMEAKESGGWLARFWSWIMKVLGLKK